MKLTETQKELVIKNHALIYHYLHSHNLSIDEYYDVVAISMCKAAQTFNEDRGVPFSSYACMIMQRDLITLFDGLSKRISPLNHECQLINITVEEDGELNLLENLPDHRFSSVEDVLVTQDIINFLNKIPNITHQKMLKMLMRGYSTLEVSQYFNLSREGVRYVRKHWFDKFLQYRERGDMAFAR